MQYTLTAHRPHYRTQPRNPRPLMVLPIKLIIPLLLPRHTVQNQPSHYRSNDDCGEDTECTESDDEEERDAADSAALVALPASFFR